MVTFCLNLPFSNLFIFSDPQQYLQQTMAQHQHQQQQQQQQMEDHLAQFSSAFATNPRNPFATSSAQGGRFVSSNGGSPVPNGGGGGTSSGQQQQMAHQQMAGFAHPAFATNFGVGVGGENGLQGGVGGGGQLVMANQLAGHLAAQQQAGLGGPGNAAATAALFAVGDARECVNCGKYLFCVLLPSSPEEDEEAVSS